MKRILIFLQDGVGGAERVSVLLGKLMPQELYDVKFCLVERGSKTSIADFIPEGYKIERIPNASPLKMMWRLVSVIRRERPHVVFSSVMYLNTKILPFRWMFPDVRFVIRCENYLYTFSKKQHRFIHFTYHKADAIIAQTQEMKDELVTEMHIDERKTTVIQNPVDTELIDRLVSEGENPYPHDGRKHIVASGRFHYQKGFDLLIKAFADVFKKRNDVDLYIIGDTSKGGGGFHQEVMALAKELGVEKQIYCVGYQKNPYVYVRYADCFVLSSRWEGLPNVMIEAQYLGTPVAAFKCIPVIERLVNDGKDGFLAEKENTDSLAEAILGAITLEHQQSSYHSTAIFDFENIVSGGDKIVDKRQLCYWCRLDFESYEMQHPLIARFTYGENWELFSYMKNLRYLEYYMNKPVHYPWDKLLQGWHWLRHRRNCKRMDIFMAPNTFGPGCHLQHRGFRHITSTTKIGANCEILPMVLLGKKKPDIDHAEIAIGDNCYIAVGVTIIGPVNIGNNVTIGAGAVVTNDIPDNCVVAGIPAKVVKNK